MSLFNDEIEWAEPPPTSRGGTRNSSTAQFVEAVKARPGQWAIFKKGSKAGVVSNKDRYPDMEWRSVTEENEPNAQRTYTIYGRYVGGAEQQNGQAPA